MELSAFKSRRHMKNCHWKNRNVKNQIFSFQTFSHAISDQFIDKTARIMFLNALEPSVACAQVLEKEKNEDF